MAEEGWDNSQKEGECFESEVSNLLNAMGVLPVAF